MRARIDETGIVVQGVFIPQGQTGDPFFYTGGFTKRGWPELVMMGGHELLGQHLGNVAMTLLVNEVKPEPGDRIIVEYDDAPDVEFRFGAVRPQWVPEHITLPKRAGLGDPVGAVQVIWHDAQGRWPGEPGWEDYAGQPMLAGSTDGS